MRTGADFFQNMKISVSKTDWETMLSLIDKAVLIIKSNQPSCKEYNVARRLRNVKNDIIRKNK